MDPRVLIRVFGENVRQARHARGWSQEELATRADLDRSYISDVERGTRNPTLLIVARIADTLGVEPFALLVSPLPDASPTPHPGSAAT